MHVELRCNICSEINEFIILPKNVYQMTNLICPSTKNYSGCLTRRASGEYVKPLIAYLSFFKYFTSPQDLKGNERETHNCQISKGGREKSST